MAGMGGGDMWGAIISGAENSMDRIGGTAFSHYWARRNEGFQREQSATQYQRAVADLRAAGLNPMLAYSQGGAHSAQGARASPSSGSRDPGQAFTSAMVAREQVKNMQQQNRLLSAEADKADVEKTLYRGLLPLAQFLEKRIGSFSAQSVKSGGTVEPKGLMDAARGKTTDLMEWIGNAVGKWSDKSTWLRMRDEYVTKEKQ